MELTIHKTDCSCLEMPIRETLTMEQSQEIRVPDDLPDVGEILGAWGQMITRGKEWRSDEIVYNGGMMIWILYLAEDTRQMHTLESWVPFTAKWDIPANTPEGMLRLMSAPRFVDARSSSPRKIIVRCGMNALAEAYVKASHTLSLPDRDEEQIEILYSRFPVRLPKEIGEKVFVVEDSLEPIQKLSASEKAIYYTVRPEITEQKVLANKIAFRGNSNLHVLCHGDDEQLVSMDFTLPFSQFAELEGSFGSDAQVNLLPLVTNLEIDIADGKIAVKCAISAQYVVDDIEIVNTAEDAYAIGSALNVTKEQVKLPVILEKKMLPMTAECCLREDCLKVLDAYILPDYPKIYPDDEQVQMESSVLSQILYEGSDGQVHGAVSKWEGKTEIPVGIGVQSAACLMGSREPQLITGSSGSSIRTELPIAMTFSGGEGIPMISGISMEQQTESETSRPSLILRRASSGTLWEIAKKSGSTMDAIRKTNHLETDPVPGQMLIIPVF